MRKCFLALAAVVALAGCAAQEPLLRKTASGLPEATFYQTSLDDARSKLIGTCASSGILVQDSGPNHVTCGKEMEGPGAAFIQMAIGNSYSSTPVRVVRFTIFPQGADVRVVANKWAESQMPTGKVNKMDLDSNVERNATQQFLVRAGAR